MSGWKPLSSAFGRPLPLMLIGAVLTALTLVFPAIGLLEWVTMIPLFVGVYRLAERADCTLRRAYGYGFLTVYVFYFVIYHWFLRLYPLDFVGMDNASSAIVIAAGWFGLPILQAATGGLIFLTFRWMHKTSIFARAPMLRPIVFAALWVVFEWSSTLSWAGVPWGRLCLGQIEMLPMLQSASLLGSYFVSFLILAVNGFLAVLVLDRTKSLLCGIIAASIFCSNLLFGAAVRLCPEKQGETLRVAVIQGNINSHEKWDSNSGNNIRKTYRDLSLAAAGQGAEFIVWPESALPYELNRSASLQKYVSELAIECNATLIVGAFYRDHESDPPRNDNALFMITPDGEISETVYAKRHLVPFGEYVPMRDLIMFLIPPLAELSALDSDLTPGIDSALFALPEELPKGKVGSLICFDSIYEQLTLDSVRDGANLMLVSSNDSWFYDSAAVYQHQAQAQLRAIESGRYLVRSANTGISSVISDEGEILAWLDPLTKGYRVADVQMRTRHTLYNVVGNLFVYLCLAFVILLPILGKLLGEPQKRPIVWKNHYGKTK
ncbi:MAG: apolipoprotein N-acyltransferase [Clostridia bacterium]|nr:apolipoprotein N-acyltransferase [Clostridia bacterium]